MILVLVGAILSILVPYIFYKRILNRGEHVDKKRFIKTFILGATLYTLPIIILEIIWDILFKRPGLEGTIGFGFSQAFFRAALLEEAVKYYFCYRILKRNRNLGMKEAILLAGIVGIGYGFTEKLVYGGAALIVNGLLPGHMVFQWFMGYFLYKALRAEGGERKRLFFIAYFVPFIVHGIWDFGLDVSGFLMDANLVFAIVGGVLMLAMVVLMYVVSIKVAIRISKIKS